MTHTPEGPFAYECPAEDCEGEMRGGFGEDVQCPFCRRWWATEWDYVGAGISAWITGPVEFDHIDTEHGPAAESVMWPQVDIG